MPNNQKRGEEALSKLERELKSRERKQKARPLGVVAASLVVILALVGGIYFLSTREGDDENVQAEESSAAETSQETPQAQPIADKRAKALPDTVTCKYEDNGQESNGAKKPNGKDISTKGTVTVSFETNQGTIEMEMDRAKAPCTTNAISELAKSGYYDDTVCHRMTSGGLNVLQCGDPDGTGEGGPGFVFKDEYPVGTDQSNLYKPGVVAMANAGQNTNGSQFFVTYADSPLPAYYTIFGSVSEAGMKTVQAIAKKGTKGGVPDGQPSTEVRIDKAVVSE